jgi:SHS2 domain-containing protein
VYWLQRPPYLRWAAAGSLVLAAFLWDLARAGTVPYPFAARDIAAGSPIDASSVRWRSMPGGLAEAPDLAGTSALVPIPAGEPITAATVGTPPRVPDGWWAVPIDLAPGVAPGDEVLLVVSDPPLTVPGIVVSPGSGDRYGLDARPASVAVPGEAAAVVAAAGRDCHTRDMRRYDVVPHTADAAVVAYGKTLAGMFENAAYAMFDIVFDLDAIAATESRSIAASGEGHEELLVAWLSEILTESEASDLVFTGFTVEALEDGEVRGEAVGTVSAGQELRGAPIKAVTYHDLAVVEVPGGWWARVVFDV